MKKQKLLSGYVTVFCSLSSLLCTLLTLSIDFNNNLILKLIFSIIFVSSFIYNAISTFLCWYHTEVLRAKK